MSGRFILGSFLALFVLGMGIVRLQAQNASTGELNGTVATQAGTPVGHAFVVASPSGANGASQTVRSGSDGVFAFSALKTGAYRVCVQVVGASFLDLT